MQQEKALEKRRSTSCQEIHDIESAFRYERYSTTAIDVATAIAMKTAVLLLSHEEVYAREYTLRYLPYLASDTYYDTFCYN